MLLSQTGLLVETLVESTAPGMAWLLLVSIARSSRALLLANAGLLAGAAPVGLRSLARLHGVRPTSTNTIKICFFIVLLADNLSRTRNRSAEEITSYNLRNHSDAIDCILK